MTDMGHLRLDTVNFRGASEPVNSDKNGLAGVPKESPSQPFSTWVRSMRPPTVSGRPRLVVVPLHKALLLALLMVPLTASIAVAEHADPAALTGCVEAETCPAAGEAFATAIAADAQEAALSAASAQRHALAEALPASGPVTDRLGNGGLEDGQCTTPSGTWHASTCNGFYLNYMGASEAPGEGIEGSDAVNLGTADATASNVNHIGLVAVPAAGAKPRLQEVLQVSFQLRVPEALSRDVRISTYLRLQHEDGSLDCLITRSGDWTPIAETGGEWVAFAFGSETPYGGGKEPCAGPTRKPLAQWQADPAMLDARVLGFGVITLDAGASNYAPYPADEPIFIDDLTLVAANGPAVPAPDGFTAGIGFEGALEAHGATVVIPHQEHFTVNVAAYEADGATWVPHDGRVGVYFMPEGDETFQGQALPWWNFEGDETGSQPHLTLELGADGKGSGDIQVADLPASTRGYQVFLQSFTRSGPAIFHFAPRDALVLEAPDNAALTLADAMDTIDPNTGGALFTPVVVQSNPGDAADGFVAQIVPGNAQVIGAATTMSPNAFGYYQFKVEAFDGTGDAFAFADWRLEILGLPEPGAAGTEPYVIHSVGSYGSPEVVAAGNDGDNTVTVRIQASKVRLPNGAPANVVGVQFWTAFGQNGLTSLYSVPANLAMDEGDFVAADAVDRLGSPIALVPPGVPPAPPSPPAPPCDVADAQSCLAAPACVEEGPATCVPVPTCPPACEPAPLPCQEDPSPDCLTAPEGPLAALGPVLEAVSDPSGGGEPPSLEDLVPVPAGAPQASSPLEPFLSAFAHFLDTLLP